MTPDAEIATAKARLGKLRAAKARLRPSRSEIMRWKRIARKAIAGERETIQALRSMRAGLYLAQGLQRDAYERVQESLIRASNIP